MTLLLILPFLVQPALNLSINSTPLNYSKDTSAFINKYSYTPRAFMSTATTPSPSPSPHSGPNPVYNAPTTKTLFPYSGAKPNSPWNSAKMATPQRQLDRLRFQGRLALNLNSTLPRAPMDSNSRRGSTALKPSPLSPKDPNMYLDDFSYNDIDDNFDQFEDDVLCTAVFRGGSEDQENTRLVVKDMQRATKDSAKKPSISYHFPKGEHGQRLSFTNRKRIIDEMFEDVGETATNPPAKKYANLQNAAPNSEQQSVSFGDHHTYRQRDMENEKNLRHKTEMGSASCGFLGLSNPKQGSTKQSVSDSIPSLSRKLAMKSGSAAKPLLPALMGEQSAKATLQNSPDEQKEMSIPDLYGFNTSESRPRSSVPKPVTCSFFTAGPTR